MYAKECPHCHSLGGPTATVCATCQASLKGVPLTHGGAAAQPQPRVGRRWDLAIFILLGGGLLAILSVMLCGLVEQPLLGLGLGMLTAAVTMVLAALAVGPVRPLDENQQWGTSALFVLLFLLAILVVVLPVVLLAWFYSLFF